MAKSKILVIEEKANPSAGNKAVLQRLGYQFARIAASVDQWVKLLEKRKPDILLLELGGVKVKKAVQAGEEARARFNIPAIYLASSKDKATLKRLKLTERFDFLVAPFSDHELYFAIETALSGRVPVHNPHTQLQSATSTLEMYFQKFLAFAPVAVIAIDEHGLIQFANLHTEELLRYTRKELIGKNFEVLIPERFRSSHEKNKANYLAHPKKRAMGVGLDIFCLQRDGKEIPVEIGLNPVLIEEKTYVLATISDITERKYSEENLRQAEAKYRTLVEQIPPIIYITGPGQHIGVTYISPRIETLGFGQEEWMADPELWLRQVHPEDRNRILAEIEQSVESGRPFSSEYRLLSRDGQVRWFLDEVVDILDNNGRLLYRQGFMLDISSRKFAEESLASRERYLALLNDMTRTILLSRDFDAVLFTLAFDMKKIIDADDCYILRWDEEKQRPIPIATTAKLDFSFSEATIGDNEFIASVLEQGHVLIVDNILNSPYIDYEIASRFPAHSIIGVPLVTSDHMLGAAILAFNSHHQFTKEETERVEQAGAQVALALWNFQQSVEIQQRLKESTALAKIGQALSERERIGTDEVLQLIVDAACELIQPTKESVIHLLETDEEILVPKAISGFETGTKSIASTRMHLGEGVAGHVIRDGVTINIGDINAHPNFIIKDTLPSFRSLLVAPVHSGRQPLGTISVQSDKLNAFSAQDAKLLNALSVQAAIAIDNTRLFEAIQQRFREVNALYRVIRGLASALETDELIQDVVALLQQNFGYYHVQIYLIEAETRNLVVKHGSGYIGNELIRKGHSLPAGEGIVGHVAETGEPFITNNTDAVVFFKRNPLLPETQSEIAVPIKVNQQVMGVLDIQHTPPHRLSESDLQLMTAVAEQLSVAIQKASLYTNLQAALQQEQAVRSQLIQSERLALVGRLLASVSHELNNPLQAIQNALFLLRDEEQLSAQGKQDLEIILSEAERMAALIERLRSAYRPIRIQDFQPLQINNIIEDVHTLTATLMRHKEIAFEFIPEMDLPTVPGIADQLRQVVLNLFLNAIEVMQTGGRLTVQTYDEPKQNEIFLTIQDTGPGIDHEILPHIFEPFITNKHSGTGLGLTITRDIIENHHGRLQASNAPEGGAMISVWLPYEEKGQDE